MTSMVDRRDDLLPIRDQGRRETCVAFAMTAGHELLDGTGRELSTEFLHWGAKQRDGLPSSAEGTTLAAAGASLADLGQPLESDWPYDDQRDPRVSSYHPPAAAVAEALGRRVGGGRDLHPTSDAIRAALERADVVALGLRLFTTWYFLNSDARIDLPPSGAVALGGHAVLVVGFEDGETSNDGLFIIRNSWGASWGERGYGLLPFTYVDSHAMAAWIVGSQWNHS